MQRKWNRRERQPERGVYALVLEEDGYEFLIDTRDLWKPPRVLVRRGYADGEVWLDEDDVSFVKSRFLPRDEKRVLALVREHIDDLLMRFLTLKDDVRRGRLGRNLLVD
jgi:hypothetical protein